MPRFYVTYDVTYIVEAKNNIEAMEIAGEKGELIDRVVFEEEIVNE